MLSRLLSLAVISAALIVGAGPIAHAGGGCPSGTRPVSTTAGAVCVVVHDPGGPGTVGTAPEKPSQGRSRQPGGCFKSNGQQVPCATDLGVWFGGHQCYAAPYNAPAGSPAWRGHAGGSLSMCTACATGANARNCNAQVIWVAPGAAPGPPDPAQMASDAMGVLRLPAARVHTAPQAPAHTYIGVENWLWVPKVQWATLTKSVSSGSDEGDGDGALPTASCGTWVLPRRPAMAPGSRGGSV